MEWASFRLDDRLLTGQQFMMDFELKIAKTTYKEAVMEGLVMAFSYALGKLGMRPALLDSGC